MSERQTNASAVARLQAQLIRPIIYGSVLGEALYPLE
jgi:hypothetical protein